MKAYSFITPDLCHDSHGQAAFASDGVVRSSDDWMRAALPPIISFVDAHEGALFIVWDEGLATTGLPPARQCAAGRRDEMEQKTVAGETRFELLR